MKDFWDVARVRGAWMKNGLLENSDGFGEASSMKTRVSNAVRILDEADCFGSSDIVLKDMAKSLKKFPLLTDKQVDFAASLILKAGLGAALATALNQLQDTGVDIHAPYRSGAADDDKVEVHRVPSPAKPEEPEPEVDLIEHPKWGMF